jgi:hypothetical protein
MIIILVTPADLFTKGEPTEYQVNKHAKSMSYRISHGFMGVRLISENPVFQRFWS